MICWIICAAASVSLPDISELELTVADETASGSPGISPILEKYTIRDLLPSAPAVTLSLASVILLPINKYPHPPARMIMRIKIMISSLFNFFLFMSVSHHSCLKISSSHSAYCFTHPPSEPKPWGHPLRTIRLVWIPIFLITSYCSSN